MKSKDITRRYKTRLILNIMISAFAACIIVSLLVYNSGRIMRMITGVSEAQTAPGGFSASAVMLLLIFGIVLFALLFYLLQRRTLRYIEEITDGVGAIAGGDFDTRIKVSGDDEFSEMAENINYMTEELKELLEYERNAEKAKTDLITNITHDLRTPLTSIIGYLELLSGKTGMNMSDEQKQKFMRIAYNKSKRLEQLITDLFSFTKLSYGKMTMRVSYLDIVKLLAQLVEEAYPAFAENGLSYEFRTNVDTLEISADPVLIARLFENLIGNAIKYGVDGKRVIVTLNAEPEKDAVEVKVINFGYVIEEKDLPHIFEKFYRADRSRSSKTGGSGLGLAIVRDIVDLHGGSINVSSDLNGTVFTVRLHIHFDNRKEQLRKA